MSDQIAIDSVRGVLSIPIDPVRRSSFLSWRIYFDEPAPTSSENAHFLVGRIFFDEPAPTSSENALVAFMDLVVSLFVFWIHKHSTTFARVSNV